MSPSKVDRVRTVPHVVRARNGSAPALHRGLPYVRGDNWSCEPTVARYASSPLNVRRSLVGPLIHDWAALHRPPLRKPRADRERRRSAGQGRLDTGLLGGWDGPATVGRSPRTWAL